MVQAYWQEYQRFADDLPSSVRNVAYLERMRKSYPFHPALIDALQERWSSLQSFQRTRGVLRLLARVAVQFYGNNLAGAMIGPANMSLYDDRIRASVIDIVGEQYEAVAASDLAEPGERARGVDRERGGLHVAKRLAEGAANTIFLYSHTGGGVPGASLRDVTLALIEPDVAPALVTDVLERLKHRLYYLHAEGELLSFKAQPNLNRVLEDRKAMVAPKVPELLRESAKGIAQSKGNAKIIAWPGSHQDVPDNRDIKIVLLGPDHPDGPEAERLIAATIDAAAGARRQFPNTVVFVIPHSASFHTAGEHARELLAIRDLEGDTGTYSTLSEVQREELRSRKTRALQAIPNALRGAYQWVCKAFAEPATPNERIRWKREARAEIQTESDVVIAVLKILETGQVFTRKLDPALLSAYYKLWNDTDQDLNTVSLRDYFSQLPHLPLLENDEVLRDAVARGISSGLFALAVKSASGYDLNTVRREGTATNVGDVEFSSVRFLVKPGVIPAPQAPSSSDLKTADPILVIEPIIPPSPSTNPTRKAKHQRVRVIFDNLEPEKSSKLIDALFTLQDGGATTLRLTIEANTAQSLDKAQIELNLPEVLSQNGLQAILEWDASS